LNLAAAPTAAITLLEDRLGMEMRTKLGNADVECPMSTWPLEKSEWQD
jgi:hypothetical protein